MYLHLKLPATLKYMQMNHIYHKFCIQIILPACHPFLMSIFSFWVVGIHRVTVLLDDQCLLPLDLFLKLNKCLLIQVNWSALVKLEATLRAHTSAKAWKFPFFGLLINWNALHEVPLLFVNSWWKRELIWSRWKSNPLFLFPNSIYLSSTLKISQLHLSHPCNIQTNNQIINIKK